LKELVDPIIKLEGPSYKGTKVSYNKLHDDKDSYTGVYKNGGPKNIDSEYDRTVDIGYGYNKSNENIENKKKYQLPIFIRMMIQ